MKINYRQITFAREYRGYSQSELSSKIKGLSQPNLSKFEKGIGILSDDVLNNIISFLDFPLPFFEKEIFNKSENAHYRKKASITKTERISLENSNRLIGYIIDQMAESLEFPEFQYREIDLEEGYTPEYVAQYIRKALNLKDLPVKDINTLLESNGIIVVELDTDICLFDGVSFITDNGYKVIVVNKSMSNDRKRFTLAHELGHLIMHSSEEFLFPDHRDKEDEANRFASEFLMPSTVIANSLRNLRLSYLLDLKRYWLTSMASIIRRAKDVGCISYDKYQYFNVELSRKGYRKEEPLNVFIDTPKIFYTAYKMHKEELEYSENDLASAFNLPMDVIKRFFINPESKLRLKINI